MVDEIQDDSDFEFETEQEGELAENRNAMKELRELYKEQNAELRAIRQENTVRAAGLDPQDPKVNLLKLDTSIDWKDASKVKEAAERYGIIAAAPPPGETQEPPKADPDAEALQRISSAGGGTEPPADPHADKPWQEPGISMEEYDRRYYEHYLKPQGLSPPRQQ